MIYLLRAKNLFITSVKNGVKSLLYTSGHLFSDYCSLVSASFSIVFSVARDNFTKKLQFRLAFGIIKKIVDNFVRETYNSRESLKKTLTLKRVCGIMHANVKNFLLLRF